MANENNLHKILNLNDESRVTYFLKEVREHQTIWILTDEHGCVMLNTEDEDCVPVWPSKETAELWINEEWNTCKAEAISLNKWYSRWTQGLLDDELAIVVFPNTNEQGVVLYPDELEDELRKK
ncbi:DUF2750 domain-containing protein [Colwellia sp. RE-S-Sl-9]